MHIHITDTAPHLATNRSVLGYDNTLSLATRAHVLLRPHLHPSFTYIVYSILTSIHVASFAVARLANASMTRYDVLILLRCQRARALHFPGASPGRAFTCQGEKHASSFLIPGCLTQPATRGNKLYVFQFIYCPAPRIGFGFVIPMQHPHRSYQKSDRFFAHSTYL